MDELRVENISVLRGRKSVISNLTVAFNSGSLVAIEGNNGSGKSTFLDAVNFYVRR
jgi:ABC-type cobalamin/Fe3+-siderophores transport system ATPase subunit